MSRNTSESLAKTWKGADWADASIFSFIRLLLLLLMWVLFLLLLLVLLLVLGRELGAESSSKLPLDA